MQADLNFDKHGVKVIPHFLSRESIQSVISEIDAYAEEMPRHGIRNAEKKFPSILKVVSSKPLLTEAQKILGKAAKIVRVIFFDKTVEKNWLVTWHQDKTVAVTGEFSKQGWGAWSYKDGTLHVQPPLEVLNEMVTFRLHLDPADNDNGCLKVILGSQRNGVLNSKEIEELVAEQKPTLCVVETGDALVMRPLLLHSSSKATVPTHRRIIHIEFSSYHLPNNIAWA